MFFYCHALAGDLIQTNFPPFAQWCFQLVQLVTVTGKEEDGEMIVTASFEKMELAGALHQTNSESKTRMQMFDLAMKQANKQKK